MGSNINFKNYGDVQNGDVNGGRLAGNFSLARQSSVYSLTFDEFQNTMGGLGKDFGSMNMDELLKNIWSAEETQGMVTSTCGAAEGNAPGGNLQRQGSLTLPRTLSQKTVDDVWKELIRDSGDAKYGNVGGGQNLPQEQRQQTLGEMTLEEFLARAGVVREDAQEMARPGNGGFFAELFRQSNNTGLAPGFQQASRNNGLLSSRVESNNNSVPNQSPNLALNVGGLRTSQQQTHQLPQQQQPIFPKPATLSFSPSMHLVSNAQLTSPRSRGPVSVVVEPSRNTAFSQGGGFPSAGIGMGGLGAGGVTVASKSPINQMSPDVIAKSSADTSSLSPVPYLFTRGRKANGALEKVVERRQRRMIKNRESAARSRARKQAYTLELEAEVAKLKEMNEELQRKQAEIVEMQKDEILETMQRKWGGKRQCLRRTLTGPW
ncbi:putative transcription factor bZIP family [Rosa chinensis]|uniref:Putative transcription factor bZIP family n=1 Tax=Rosa chinensis TaxID=74649 RepID=A0A2P6PME6_ROSCH|nr:ABSCISIC ACID-INSENSITIVE 5-like protein 7 isoform X1 [Rosa chinensis]XP_024163059.1 ABSCISIC ACID-INSENSITIVE 5-like protein 7 isoform X1 [Rosa chinensis]PRQ23108.1 putative transcription factor bZIP family [Rosa chinensis]